MLINSNAIISISDAVHNFKKITETVEKYGVAHVVRKVTPVCCFISVDQYRDIIMPDCIKSVTTTFANQYFTTMLAMLEKNHIMCITKRKKTLYYVVDAEYMDAFVEDELSMKRQIMSFYDGFMEQYNKTELLLRTIMENEYD